MDFPTERHVHGAQDPADFRFADLVVRLLVVIDLVDRPAGGQDIECVHGLRDPVGLRGSIAAMWRCSGFLIVLFGLMLPTARAMDLGAEQLAWHWQPQSAQSARAVTLAAQAWLEDEAGDLSQWRQRIEAHRLTLSRQAMLVPPDSVSTFDGLFAWLTLVRERNLQVQTNRPPEPSLDGLNRLLRDQRFAGRVARLYPIAALQAPAIWRGVHARLSSAPELDADAQIQAFWDDLEIEWSMTQELEVSASARTLAGLAVRYDQANESERAGLHVELLLEQAAWAWRDGRRLATVWSLMEGLMRLAALAEPVEYGAGYLAVLDAMAAGSGLDLRHTDMDLPLIVAMLKDALGHLNTAEPGVTAAITELADAYARLALFAASATDYLDQPVREDVRSAIGMCNPDPLLVGPLPREVFEQCLETLFGLLQGPLGREELVGDSNGPFSPLFLDREMGLISWQRAAYLDGYLNWQLTAGCAVPDWENPLEWSMVVQYLTDWATQRPVYFGTERWRAAVARVRARLAELDENRMNFIDCITGVGGNRIDPLLRLFDGHAQALSRLESRLTAVNREFYLQSTRPQADIDLEGGADQTTAYRPEGLMVGPCPQARACDVRALLPVSRALLNQFPNAYLLADQLDMGRLSLCYDNVRWVERTMNPLHERDSQVADFSGRLSFELIGRFAGADRVETVLRQRLTAAEPQRYLFSAAEPQLLELDCPNELKGSPIASHLPDGGTVLVPNRLTYFTSLPTSAETQMLSNWDRGAEWRDWFVTGQRVETLERRDGSELAAAVETELSALVSRRERLLAGRLLMPSGVNDDDSLATAMAEVAASSALIRRMLEIHYPRAIRHRDGLRALISGELALLTRDRVRRMHDAGLSLRLLALEGFERLSALRSEWNDLPMMLRESGQPIPELDFAREHLDRLRELSQLGRAAETLQPSP